MTDPTVRTDRAPTKYVEPPFVALLDPKGRLRVPTEIWEALGLAPGIATAWDIHLSAEGILLKPKAIDPDQWWFWTPEWPAGEREVDRAIAEGRMTFHASTEEFLAHLDALDDERKAGSGG